MLPKIKNIISDKDYNSSLRCKILIYSVQCEEAASNAIRFLLRTVKQESKTLGNKSSSLSFKNKIDLLFDLDDITEDEYKILIKFMEIRNQFIHNPNCSSFIDLKKESPDSVNFLKKKFQNDIKNEELSYSKSFDALYKKSLGKLLLLNIEYEKGYKKELIRFFKSKALDKFSCIFKDAIEDWKNKENVLPQNNLLNLSFTNEYIIQKLLIYLKKYLEKEEIKIIDKYFNHEIEDKDIFQRRVDIKKELFLKNKLK